MSNTLDLPENGDRASLFSVRSVKPSPDTLTKLIKRLRALTLVLLPVEVDSSSINDPTSRVITPQVIDAYMAAAGDFTEALPYCLLRSRAEFMWDANNNPADYGENVGRAIACEVLARRIVHIAPHENLRTIMSSRFRHRQVDGDESEMSSALEVAIDSHCTIFLSSNEAQEDVPYADTREHSFWGHMDPSRLNVPRYQNIFRIAIWLFFLVAYSQAGIREPLERLGDSHSRFDEWEIVIYTMGLAFTMEGMSLNQFLPLLYDDLINLYSDLHKSGIFFAVRDGACSDCEVSFTKGNQQLLSVLAIGFTQALFALDAADGSTDGPSVVVHVLIQALLGSPDYGKYSERWRYFLCSWLPWLTKNVPHSPPGLILYYLWNTVTAIVLLNVLISLFSSAYSDVIEDAEAQYLAFFASKTIAMIRAPDSFVYPAPFSLVETFFVAPFEMIPGFKLSAKAYTTLNRYVMSVLFFVPLTVIAFYEATFDRQKHAWMNNWLRGDDEGAGDYPETKDPEVDELETSGKISKVPFDELVKKFPNTEKSSEAAIIQEIHELRKQLARLVQKLEA
ncbi:hypothetical protein C0991_003565 [Blastosporella zonata]|nr:hypothetical protein C0991_003565 [Blastosporella zonata]